MHETPGGIPSGVVLCARGSGGQAKDLFTASEATASVHAAGRSLAVFRRAVPW